MDSGLTVLSGPHVCQALYQALRAPCRALTAQRSSGPHVERLSSRCAPHTISTYASCCGLRRDRMEAISLSGPGTHPWSPPPPGTTKLACPTHTPSHAKQGPELNEGDPGWPHPPAHKMHPPAHASAPAAVRPQSQRARPSLLRQHESPPQITSVQRSPSLLHPSGPRRQSQQPIPLTSLWPSKAEPAAHPSYIPLVLEGRASSPSLLHPSGPRRPSQRRFASVCVILHPSLVSIDHRFIRSSECKVSYTTVAGSLGSSGDNGKAK